MKLNAITIQGFKNLTQPITFGPFQAVNVLHGANNIGKSNILQAVEIFFRLLGTGNQVGNGQIVGLENGETLIGCSFEHLFHLVTPSPIQWRVELSIPTAELEEVSIDPEMPTESMVIAAELIPGLGDKAQFRIQQFLFGETDVSKLDQEKDEGVAFAQMMRTYISGMLAIEASRRTSPYIRIDLSGRDPRAKSSEQPGGRPERGLVPQSIRDSLFDARMAVDREQRRRWVLFQRLAQVLAPELGPGMFDTAFSRKTGHADLVFDTGDVAYPVDWLGRGVQQTIALLGSLALTHARYVALEEPELYLALPLQGRLPSVLATVIESGVGPLQFFIASQSRALDRGDNSFVLEPGEEGLTLTQRAWDEGGVSVAGSGATSLPPLSAPGGAGGAGAARAGEANLDNLIGLVDQLSELDPQEIVGTAPGGNNRPKGR
jgi:hypothetical protein